MVLHELVFMQFQRKVKHKSNNPILHLATVFIYVYRYKHDNIGSYYIAIIWCFMHIVICDQI